METPPDLSTTRVDLGIHSIIGSPIVHKEKEASALTGSKTPTVGTSKNQVDMKQVQPVVNVQEFNLETSTRIVVSAEVKPAEMEKKSPKTETMSATDTKPAETVMKPVDTETKQEETETKQEETETKSADADRDETKPTDEGLELAESPPRRGKIEEGSAAYGKGGLHPVFIGDIYNDKYEIMRKIGYGQYSTVWLVKDITQEEGNENQYMALKIIAAYAYYESNPIYEREILIHLRDADKSHPGYQHICHLVDDFKHQGPNGSHVCLVFELMGETLATNRTMFKKQLTPNTLMRKFTTQILMALDYAHDNRIIHTDIKPDNLFVKFRARNLIAQYLEENPAPRQDRTARRYAPIRSQSMCNYYSMPGDPVMNLDITVGDWGVSSWEGKHLCEVIQPVTLRAPEVLIGAPWDWTTDWWNLGAVLLEVFRGAQMFTGQLSQYSPYEVKLHLLAIEHFFGPFPKSLLDKGEAEIVQQYFSDDGTIKDPLPSHGLALTDDFYMDDLPQDTREKFVDFLKALMKVDPAERFPTMHFLEMPWITGE